MILGLISFIMGIFIFIILWPFTFESFNSIATLIALLLLIGFGGRIFFIDLKSFLKYKKQEYSYLNNISELLEKNQVAYYPTYDLVKHKKVLNKVKELIETKQIKDAQPILNNDISFHGARLKFLFFSWIFKENDEYTVYKSWKRIYHHINHATKKVISDVLMDAKQGHNLVDIINTRSNTLTNGSYLLKKENEQWKLIKIPIHIRYINDDFYGTMIYDYTLDQPIYTFESDDIISKRRQHIKQTTKFFLDIEGNQYKKDDTKKIKCLSVKLKNEDEFDMLSYDLPF